MSYYQHLFSMHQILKHRRHLSRIVSGRGELLLLLKSLAHLLLFIGRAECYPAYSGLCKTHRWQREEEFSSEHFWKYLISEKCGNFSCFRSERGKVGSFTSSPCLQDVMPARRVPSLCDCWHLLQAGNVRFVKHPEASPKLCLQWRRGRTEMQPARQTRGHPAPVGTALLIKMPFRATTWACAELGNGFNGRILTFKHWVHDEMLWEMNLSSKERWFQRAAGSRFSSWKRDFCVGWTIESSTLVGKIHSDYIWLNWSHVRMAN